MACSGAGRAMSARCRSNSLQNLLPVELRIHHRLTYRYDRSVSLGPQRLLLYPRLTPRQQLLAYRVEVGPRPAGDYLQLDAESNTVRWLYFSEAAKEVTVRMSLHVASPPFNPFAFLIYPADRTRLPFVYPEPQRTLLAPALATAEIAAPVARWTRELLDHTGGQTVPFLSRLTEIIHRDFAYQLREEGPPLAPAETLTRGRGSCRDLACLMMAACRSVGLAARFVSGYAWAGDDPASHELHAWVEVYLPGAGWRGFDPTMGVTVAEGHLALAASVLPERAAPMMGHYYGEGRSTLEAEVHLEVMDDRAGRE